MHLPVLPRNHFLTLVSLFKSNLRDKPAVGLSVSDVDLSAFLLIPISRSLGSQICKQDEALLPTMELPCRD